MEISDIQLCENRVHFKVSFEDFLCGEEVIRYKNITFVVDKIPFVANFHVEGEVYCCHLIEQGEIMQLFIMRDGDIVGDFQIDTEHK